MTEEALKGHFPDPLAVEDTAGDITDPQVRGGLILDAMTKYLTGSTFLEGFLLARSTFELISSRRKEENARLQEYDKVWKDRHRELECRVIEAVKAGGDVVKGSNNPRFKCALGSISLQPRPTWKVNLADFKESDQLEALLALAKEKLETDANDQALELLAEHGMIEMRPKLTSKGKEVLGQHAIDLFKTNGELVPWAHVSPPGHDLRVSVAKEVKAGAGIERAAGMIQSAMQRTAQLQGRAREREQTEMAEAGDAFAFLEAPQ